MNAPSRLRWTAALAASLAGCAAPPAPPPPAPPVTISSGVCAHVNNRIECSAIPSAPAASAPNPAK